jgi:hypothetical protein
MLKEGTTSSFGKLSLIVLTVCLSQLLLMTEFYACMEAYRLNCQTWNKSGIL